MLTYMLNTAGDAYEVVGEDDTTVSKVVIPDTYEGLPVTVVSVMFWNYPNLKEIIVGNNVKRTEYGTFNCPSLERIYFGRSIETINGPFDECENLAHIFYSGTESDWQKVNLITVDSFELFEKAEKHFGILGKTGLLTFGEETLLPYTHWDCVKGKPETIDSEKVFYDNSISGLKADNVKDAIDELNARHFDATALESWTDLLHLVRSGRAAEFVNIGDQFVSSKDGKELVWDVIGINEDTPVNTQHEYSLTLQLRNCYINLPFSVPEATLFSIKEIPAGQYYVGVKNYASDTVYYSFTLPEALPSGGLIKISSGMVYLYKSRREESFLSFEIDASSDNPESFAGSELKTSNYCIHSEMGNVNYSRSDVRQWMNSADENWWIFDNDYSLAPLEYLSLPGFCNGMDEDFLAAVNPVQKNTVLPDGTVVSTADKFFLLSDEEVYAAEGKAYSFYRENSSLSEAGANADSVRIKTLDASPCQWFLRTSAKGDNGLMKVNTDGAVDEIRTTQILALGVAPVCCIC